MYNSIRQNKYQVVDGLHLLKILRTFHPSYSSHINTSDFLIFRDFKGKQKSRHLQGLIEILTAFQELWDNIAFEELQMVFESWRELLR
jgi:hypothetical protein